MSRQESDQWTDITDQSINRLITLHTAHSTLSSSKFNPNTRIPAAVTMTLAVSLTFSLNESESSGETFSKILRSRYHSLIAKSPVDGPVKTPGYETGWIGLDWMLLYSTIRKNNSSSGTRYCTVCGNLNPNPNSKQSKVK